MAKTISIIGAGIAGLAAGCYAQMNGYDSQIFEMHYLPGGLCTAWERQGYTFDGCLHYLFGSKPGHPFHDIWEELGAVQGRTMINHDEIMRVVDPDGATLIVYSDPDRLEAHMMELSPADASHINALCDGVRRFLDFDMTVMQQKPKELVGALGWAALGRKMLPYSSSVARWGTVSIRDFADRFESPFLRRALPHIFVWPDIPMMVGMTLLAYMHQGNAGFPAGASLAFARAIEQRYLELGGQIHYRAPVEKVLVEQDSRGRKRAVGLRLYDNSVHRSDYVISAADGRSTIFHLLGGEFADAGIRHMYDGHLALHSQVQVSLGVDQDLSSEPHWTTYLLSKPLTIVGEERSEIFIKHYCFDPSLAPKGKSVLIALLTSHYDYWHQIYGHKWYDTEQTEVSDIIVDFLEGIYPGLRTRIEVVDEATPLSYERYTGNWQGSGCGWLLTKQTLPMMIRGVSKTLPGLNNFFMAGQWVEPGGSVPIVAMSGRNAIQLICHGDGRRFRTEVKG